MPKSAMLCQANLEDLADALIARHLRLSLPDSTVRDPIGAAAGPEIYNTSMVESRTRCLAVVGAGASASQLARGDELAAELESKFERDEAELERLELVSGLKRDHFETRLMALSKVRTRADEVRQAISEKYGIRHPALVGYELLAHLLKHRFLDGIISFNFDELLDRSLDDELGRDEYGRVVSERDCQQLQTDADAPRYVPLYVKLHGTASEPQSLRFTLDAYYALPLRMVEVVRDLLHAERCVLIVVGAGLESFDFQRLLGIPDELQVFNLSMQPIKAGVAKRITKERRRIDKERGRTDDRKWLRDCAGNGYSSDDLLKQLTGIISDKASRSSSSEPEQPTAGTEIDGLVKVRSVCRHETVVRLLEGHSGKSKAETEPKWRKADEIDYIERRTILELALSGAKARGLLSLIPLVEDRPAKYYETYQHLTQGNRKDWSTLCSDAGLMESLDTTDILVSQKSLRKSENATGIDSKRLHEFDPRKLACHLLPRIKSNWGADDEEDLAATIDELQTESDVEIHTTDDRVCSKAFREPTILATATSLQAYTWRMLKGLDANDEVCVSSETGAWLLKKPIVDTLKMQRRIRVLLAFDIERKKLKETYKGRLRPVFTDPWHHNRHMTIVCKGKRPVRAIYFARRLRTPVITPVYLESLRDVQLLMRMYEERWDEASYQRPKLAKG